MEFYDKFVDRFQGPVKRILLSPRGMSNKYLVLPKENFFGECEAVILTMLYVKVPLSMVPHNS